MRTARWLVSGVLCLGLVSAEPKQTSGAPKGAKAPNKKNAAYAFKDFQIGMLFNDLKEGTPLLRRNSENTEATGGWTDTIADEECFVFLKFADYGKGLQLDYIGITAQTSAFDAITDALKRKYGTPALTRLVTKKNAMGAAFHGREYTWSNSLSTLFAEELGSKIDECRISWSMKGQGTSKAQQAKKTKASSDI